MNRKGYWIRLKEWKAKHPERHVTSSMENPWEHYNPERIGANTSYYVPYKRADFAALKQVTCVARATTLSMMEVANG